MKINERLVKDFKIALEAPKTTYKPNYSPTGYNGQQNQSSYQPTVFKSISRKPHDLLLRLNNGIDDFKEFGETPRLVMDAIVLFFYNESSLSKGCRYYDSLSEFYKFMAEYDLNLTDANKSRLKCGTPFWAACKPGKHDICIFPSRRELVNFLTSGTSY